MRGSFALILCSTLAVGCAHMGVKEKTLSAVAIGALSGAIITAAVATNQKDIDQKQAIPINALIGAAAGGAYSLFLMKDETSEKNAAMQERLIREASEKSEAAMLNDGKFPRIKTGCSDEDSLYFCSSSDPRVPGDCKDIGTIYLNKNTAVKYKVWYSPNGCFEDKDAGSYKLVPELEKYFDKVRKS